MAEPSGKTPSKTLPESYGSYLPFDAFSWMKPGFKETYNKDASLSIHGKNISL
jgi:hypothetical protein